MTSRTHRYYLSLGSNLRPAENLSRAISRLRSYGQIHEISSAWESKAVGSRGPNFLNVCLAIALPLGEQDLKRDVLRKIEAALGRVRTQDKFAPREIDIDILMADGRPLNLSRWNDAFVIMPMSELLPQFEHPRLRRPLEHVARGVQEKTWIVRRPDALDTISQKL